MARCISTVRWQHFLGVVMVACSSSQRHVTIPPNIYQHHSTKWYQRTTGGVRSTGVAMLSPFIAILSNAKHLLVKVQVSSFLSGFPMCLPSPKSLTNSYYTIGRSWHKTVALLLGQTLSSTGISICFKKSFVGLGFVASKCEAGKKKHLGHLQTSWMLVLNILVIFLKSLSFQEISHRRSTRKSVQANASPQKGQGPAKASRLLVCTPKS